MQRCLDSLFLVCAMSLVVPQAASAADISIDTVPVGDVGNVGDPQPNGPFGSVNYAYRIGATEVTNGQYVDFLNAKAADDPLGLYNAKMGSSYLGGITQSGLNGGFTYAPKPNMADKPVAFVSWFDSIRFANWLNNGQGTGDTETGAYTLLGGTATPSNWTRVARNPGATWFLPSENEWHKAAFYQPAAQGGDADNYWLYPTRSNSTPTIATASSVGEISNPGANVANYAYGADWNNQNGNLTTVGSAGALSNSFYGTSDQGGNVNEWSETKLGSNRIARGGSLASVASHIQAGFRDFLTPDFEGGGVGFRVATVPEPSTAVLAGVALGWAWIQRKRFK